MKKSGRYLAVIILFLFVITLSVSFSYFSANIINKDIKETKISTGKVGLEVDDVSIVASNIAPIYDEGYESLAIHKKFTIKSNNSNLNACTKVYLYINSITDSLKSEYFKYKLVYDDYEKDGNFLEAYNDSNLLLDENIFIESKESKTFDLYIWISYENGIDQTNMLGGSMKSNVYIEGIDIREESSCRR